MNDKTTTRRARNRIAAGLAPALVAGGLIAAAAMQPVASASTSRSKTENVVHTLKTSKYGTILVTAKGFALYTYGKDTKNHSTVTGPLLSFWPALLVPAGVTPTGTHVTGLGVILRSKGKHQVTFKNKPLYLFLEDTKAGQVTGNGVNGFAVAKVSATTSHAVMTTTSTGGYSY